VLAQASPLYISEMAPAQQRGMLNILFQFMITVGILTANMVNYLSSGIEGGWGWRIGVTFGAVPAAVIALGSLVIPDTPISLLARGEVETARETLAQIRGLSDVREEFECLSAASEDSKAVAHPWRELFFGGKYKPQLTFCICIPFFQQLTGINVIMFYAPVLFRTVGFKQNATLVSSVITGLVNVFSTFVATITADKVGRRALFLQGGTQMIISQVPLHTYSSVVEFHFFYYKQALHYGHIDSIYIYIYISGRARKCGMNGDEK
jgi:MFS transporter, SP family, sugar:H+ symporter